MVQRVKHSDCDASLLLQMLLLLLLLQVSVSTHGSAERYLTAPYPTSCIAHLMLLQWLWPLLLQHHHSCGPLRVSTLIEIHRCCCLLAGVCADHRLC
jgi:hypothetical protein